MQRNQSAYERSLLSRVLCILASGVEYEVRFDLTRRILFPAGFSVPASVVPSVVPADVFDLHLNLKITISAPVPVAQ